MLQARKILATLEALRRADHDCLVFGASSHQYELRPTISEEHLLDFEGDYRIRLPDDYRQFLLHVGNGGAGPFYGVLGLDELYELKDDVWGILSRPFPFTSRMLGDPDLLQQIHELANVDHEESWRLQQKYWSDMTHDGAIVIAERGCNLRCLLVVQGTEHGHIWFDDLADNEGFSPVILERSARSERPARWCHGSDTRRRTTFGEWYQAWLDFACELVEAETGTKVLN